MAQSGFDRRRINGPEESFAPIFEDEDSPDDRWSAGKPRAGRNPGNTRPIFLRPGLIDQANGSAYIETGNTKIACAIYGPRQSKNVAFHDKGRLNVELKFAPFSCSRRRAPIRDAEDRSIAMAIHQAILPSVRIETLPKATVDIFITIIEADGIEGCIASGSIAASAALIDAGIEVFGLVVSTSAAIIGEEAWLDPNAQEASSSKGTFVLASMPALGTITNLWQNGAITPSQLLSPDSFEQSATWQGRVPDRADHHVATARDLDESTVTREALHSLPEPATMDDNDPISQFFPGEEDVDLYAVLKITRDATSEAIKKSYRRLALMYHPDKHTTSSEQVKAEASTKFQQVGFAYAVLSDEKRKTRYDKLGKTDEGFELAAGEDGWEAYFEDLFDRLTRGKLDELKKEYQGSQEEVDDLKKAYLDTGGSIGEILTHIPHSTHDDEARFVMIISSLISKKELKSTRTWEKSVKDEKAKLARKKDGEKEAKEAEELAKELGVWDEFYGSGKATERKKGKGKAAGNSADEEGDVSALQALILKKRQKNADDLIDSLAAKYAPKAKAKGKKRAREDDVEEELSSSKKKRGRAATPPELDDEEFAKIQERLFGDKAKKAGGEEPKAKKSRARRK